MNKIKAAVIGATGYAGAELVRLLLRHKNVQVTGISSVSFKDQSISDIYNNFKGEYNEILKSEDEAIKDADVVFACLPHGLSEPIAKKCFEKNKIFIDLGADFRIDDENTYKKWYGKEFNEKELHNHCTYGLCELNREKIKTSKIIANPGCYPTSIILGLAPLLKNHLIDAKTIIADSKSGTTGAGRGLSMTTHYPECNESLSAYKVFSHRHTPEISQELSKLSGETAKVLFTPHLLPINRGILSTVYADFKENTETDIQKLYEDFYKDCKFVKIMPQGTEACIKNVTHSNYCHISLHKLENKVIIVSCIDNMIKGAAGQAIQNMNIIFGFDEDEGIDMIPSAF